MPKLTRAEKIMRDRDRKKTQRAKAVKKFNRAKKDEMRNTKVNTTHEEAVDHVATIGLECVAVEDILLIIITMILHCTPCARKIDMQFTILRTIKSINALRITSKCFNEVFTTDFRLTLHKMMHCVNKGHMNIHNFISSSTIRPMPQLPSGSSGIKVVFTIQNDSDENIYVLPYMDIKMSTSRSKIITKGETIEICIHAFYDPMINQVRQLVFYPCLIGHTEVTWDRKFIMTCEVDCYMRNKSELKLKKVTFKGFKDSATPPKNFEKISEESIKNVDNHIRLFTDVNPRVWKKSRRDWIIRKINTTIDKAEEHKRFIRHIQKQLEREQKNLKTQECLMERSLCMKESFDYIY
jgi:hypothetical protein